MIVKEIVHTQFKELIKKYPNLMLRWQENLGIIEGELYFKASFNDIMIEDNYNIRIEIPGNYPLGLPLTKEIGKRIPALFHKNGNDILCLEVETKMHMEFMQNPTLLFYIDKFVVEYLYGFSFKKIYGHLPYGERPHGIFGIIEFYKELFNVKNVNCIINFLKILSNNNYRGHHQCPCNNGTRIRSCHGKEIINLLSFNISDSFNKDLNLLIDYIKQSKHYQ